MKIQDIPTPELRHILRVTARDIGADSMEVRILRRELDRRARLTQTQHPSRAEGGVSCAH